VKKDKLILECWTQQSNIVKILKKKL